MLSECVINWVMNNMFQSPSEVSDVLSEDGGMPWRNHPFQSPSEVSDVLRTARPPQPVGMKFQSPSEVSDVLSRITKTVFGKPLVSIPFRGFRRAEKKEAISMQLINRFNPLPRFPTC